MNCPDCGCEHLPAAARFCPECGSRLASPMNAGDTLGPAQEPGTQIRIEQRVGEGDATGLKVDEIHGGVQVVQGHVFNIVNPSPELLRQLSGVKAVSSELTPRGEGAALNQQNIDAMQAPISDILSQVRVAEQRGARIDEVQVGEVHLSRVELLLKRAILLQTEADQMYLDQLYENRSRLDQAKQPTRGETFELDMGDMLAGFDEAAHTAKLQEAYRVLQEAQQIDPANAEVLLHMAQVVDQLTDDPQQTQRILLQVQNLLNPPRTDVDRFHLAQAVFLAAVTGEYTNPDGVRNARDLFAQLGRPDWVRHCDNLLNPSHDNVSFTGPAHGGGDARVHPSGRWHAQLSDGSELLFDLWPDGTLQGMQSNAQFGVQVPFNGEWLFDQDSSTLQLQGVVGGGGPFLLHVRIHERWGNGYRGLGSDGLQYLLRPSPV